MVDFYDRAQELEERQREEALSSQQRRAGLGAAGSAICHDCGDCIPQGRREAYPSAIRCVGCQDRHERRTSR